MSLIARAAKIRKVKDTSEEGAQITHPLKNELMRVVGVPESVFDRMVLSFENQQVRSTIMGRDLVNSNVSFDGQMITIRGVRFEIGDLRINAGADIVIS